MLFDPSVCHFLEVLLHFSSELAKQCEKEKKLKKKKTALMDFVRQFQRILAENRHYIWELSDCNEIENPQSLSL